VNEYGLLEDAYRCAVAQAAHGKGKVRHAEDGEPFERQIICEVARRVGLGYPLGQAVKKIYESQRLGGTAGLDELLGAMNYLAAAFIVMSERIKDDKAACGEEIRQAVLRAVGKLGVGPEYKVGDAVQFCNRAGVSDWTDAVYEGSHPSGAGHIIYSAGFGRIAVDSEDLRPAPKKAEGCEDLVFDEARMRESMPGIVPQDGPSDLDGEPAIYGAHIE